jgi:cell division protein ZapB
VGGIIAQARPCRPLTRQSAGTIVAGMVKKAAPSVTEQELKKLEFRLDELIQTIHRLKEENRSLRSQQDNMASERAGLIEKNELARSRVEAMINRLKAMEQGA